MMTNDDNFRCDCIEMTRAIRNKLNAEFPTMDDLFGHLVKIRQERTSRKNATLHNEVAT